MSAANLESMQVVILSGGLGTRMQARFPDIPKALIPVHGKTFLDWQIELLEKNGFRKILIITGHLSEKLEKYLRDNPPQLAKVKILDEGPKRRGTGGALKFAETKGELDQDFFLIYGDSYLPINYEVVLKTYIEKRKSILMTVFKNDAGLEKGNVEFDPSTNEFKLYDKFNSVKSSTELSYVDYGVSLLNKNIFSRDSLDHLVRTGSTDNFDLADLYHELSLKNQIAGLEIKQRFYEVGSEKGLNDFETYLKNK